MEIEFLDANVFLGRPARAIYGAVSRREELLAALDSVGIQGVLVWHIAQQEYDAGEGNRLLSEALGDCDRLYGCWTIVPPQTDKVIGEDLFARMKAGRIGALRAFPGNHRYLLNRQVFGNFLDQLAPRRIPLMLSMEPATDWPTVYRLLRDYPELPLILCDVGVWGQDRNTWPLLERYPHVLLETSLLSLEASGLELAAQRFGADRLVFGSGFPLRYPEAAMLDLLRAEISEEDKRRIASGNLRQWLEEGLA